MRGFLAFLFVGLVALGAGAVGYNIGVSQTAAATATTSGATVVYAGGWHLGGLLLLPFAFFLVPLFFMAFFGFLAFIFGPRHRFAGHGYGPMGGGGPGGWDTRRAWVAEQHRRLHEEEARGPAAPGSNGAGSSTPGGPGAG